jgi:hypothetical protein
MFYFLFLLLLCRRLILQQVEEFVENLNFLRDIQMREDEIKLKFNAVTDMYKMMEAYNVRVPDEEFALYQTLAPTHAQLGESISSAIANKEASIPPQTSILLYPVFFFEVMQKWKSSLQSLTKILLNYVRLLWKLDTMLSTI